MEADGISSLLAIMKFMMKKILKYSAFSLLGLVVALLAIGTVVEKMYGSFAYSSPYMLALWVALTAVSIAYILSVKLYCRPAIFCIHASLVVILVGALTTWLTKEEGKIVLTQGEKSSQFATADGANVAMPFGIDLENFEIVYYPATNTPADFVSHVSVTDGIHSAVKHTISMNKPLSLNGYRIFQSGYGSDGVSTVLTVTYDPYGTFVTYCGYILLLLSFVGYLMTKSTMWRITLSKLRSGAVVAVMVLCGAFSTGATNAPKVLPASLADEFCDLFVLYGGRVCVAHTLARDFTAKISGKTSFEGYTAEQVFTGWMLFPESWNEVPIVKVKDSAIRTTLGMQGSYTSARSFFDDYGEFRLKQDASDVAMMGTRKPTATMEIEDKINLINTLTEGTLLKIFPCKEGKSIAWYGFGDRLPDSVDLEEARFVRLSMSYFVSLCMSGNYDEASQFIGKLQKLQQKKCGEVLPSQTKVSAENLYNNISQVRLAAILLIILSLIFLADYCAKASKGREQSGKIILASHIVAGVMAVYITVVIALRWYVSGHVPMSNGYETMLFMSWCAFPVALLLNRYSNLLSTLAMLMSGLCLMVASISQMNPQISPLVPVLQSPLLCLHVAVIMLAYCLLAFMMLTGLVGVIMRYVSHKTTPLVCHLALIEQAILIPAVMCLAIGIFIGAVWAGFSWGRYWGWDPKEVWALITLMVYSLPLHSRRFSAQQHPMTLHTFLLIAFVTVLITYFGVNYLLGGMHSYA